MYEEEIIDYLAKYNGFEKDYKNLFPNKEETIRLLMKVTLPNDLDDSFFLMQDEFLKGMNSRLELVNPKKLKFKNKVAAFKGDPLSIEGDILLNPLFSSFYDPSKLMERSFNEDIIFRGGLEIRRDILKDIATQNHEMENGEIHIGKAYNLPFNEIIHFSLPNDLTSKDNISLLSKTYLSSLKEAEKRKGKYIVIPLTENKPNENALFYIIAISYVKTTYSKKKFIFAGNDDKTFSSFKDALIS